MHWPDPPVARDLAQRLGDLGFSVSGVRDCLSPSAADALDRGLTLPARRMLRDDSSSLAAVIRLFLLAESVPLERVEAGLGRLAQSLADVLEITNEGVKSRVELAPYEVDETDWLVAADWPSGRTGRPLADAHVLGVGGASTMLAQCTVRPKVERALDIGTGCGVQALHLAEHTRDVVVTDISDRCLGFAEFNFSMNDVRAELRQGNLFEPVENQRFDLIVSNPPFVIGSPAESRHDYRDSGIPGDALCAALVAGAADHLTTGGWCQFLANWEITDQDDWARHPRRWLADSALDAWVVQRDVSDPAAYVEGWLRDSGDQRGRDFEDHYDAWLTLLESRGVLGVGFGLVTLRLGAHNEPIRVFQHALQTVVQPVGPDVLRWFAAKDRLAGLPGAEVLIAPWRCAEDVEVVEERYPGAAMPHGRSLHRRTGFAWSGPVDDFGVTLLARLDGATPIGLLIEQLATDMGADPVQVLSESVSIVTRLVTEGFLVEQPATARPIVE